MKIGYPSLNRSIRDIRLRSFRLTNLNEAKLFSTIENNLDYLERVLQFNAEHGFGFFRIHSDTVPFAPHPKCTFDWRSRFGDRLREIGAFIRDANMRISMHPGKFTLLNSPRGRVVNNSLAVLRYHADLLDLMELDTTAKIQIHIGGTYGDKDAALERFIRRYEKIDETIQQRLALENDDTGYSIANAIEVHRATGIPVVVDAFHHNILNNGESLEDVMAAAAATWKPEDGKPMVEYSSQQPGGPIGRRSDTLDDEDFRMFIRRTRAFDFDLMLETRDKERSALSALEIARAEERFLETEAHTV